MNAADLLIRPSIIVVFGLALDAALGRRSAALRHCVLAVALFAAAAVVPLGGVLPSWDLPSSNLPARPATVELADPARNTPPAMAVTVVAEDAARGRSSFLPLMLVVWAAGVALGAGMLLAGLGRLAWIASHAVRVQDGPWVRIAAQVSGVLGVTRRVRILQTEAPGLLATWGLVRPCVLLPAHAPQWSEQRIRVVLSHELAHIRRHDWLVQMAAELLRIVYWFNPLLWLACVRLRRESEQACDDVVLRAGVPAREYAAHLLELARSCRRPAPRFASALPMARPSTLERRIGAMLNPGLDRATLSRRAIGLTALALLVVTLPTAAFRGAQSEPLPLTGSVYDTSGAVVPQVELTLTREGQVPWEAITDTAGHFEFAPVEPGKYVLEASLAGFHPLRQEIELQEARDWDRAITLQVGQLQETIVVREERVAQEPSTSASPAPGPEPIKVGGNVRAPRKLHDVKPVYPPAMRNAGREGIVPMEAVIGRDGSVNTIRVLSAQIHPDFAVAAVDAVRQWRFSPTLLNGEPIEVVMTVSVEFGLSD